MFYHKARNIRLVVHGDDFIVLADVKDLNWYKAEMENRYEIKLKARLGPSGNHDKSVGILNRVVYWDNNGIHYEPDQRHA